VSRRHYAFVVGITAPVLVGAFLTSAAFGPIGAVLYGTVLLLAVNARHLFREHRDDTRTSPIQTIRERLHR
jgi:hypothetical protein